jgi:hypothetical protein
MEGEHLEDLGVDGRIIRIKMKLKKVGGEAGTGSSWLRTETDSWHL